MRRITPQILLFSGLCVFGFQLAAMMSTSSGRAGIDYQQFIPHLFDGLISFKVKGLSVPYYTVSFCGALPELGNPQSFFYSLPQFLTFHVDPFTALQITALICTIIGGIGMFALVRRCFAFDSWIAVWCALMFAASGFFPTRMIIGHISNHSFMLLPLLCLLILARDVADTTAVAGIGLLLAYFVYSGAHFVPFAALFSCPMVCLLCFGIPAGVMCSFGRSLGRALCGLFAGILIGAAKIVAVWSFMRFFPREVVSDRITETGTALHTLVYQLFLFPFFSPEIKRGIWEYNSSLSWLASAGLVALSIRGLVRFFQLCRVNIGGISNFAEGRKIFVEYLQRYWHRLIYLAAFVGMAWIVWVLMRWEGPLAEALKTLPLFRSQRVSIKFTSAFIMPLIIISGYAAKMLTPAGQKVLALLTVPLCCLQLIIAATFIPDSAFPFDLSTVKPFFRQLAEATPDKLRLVAVGRGDYTMPVGYAKQEDFIYLSQMKLNPSCYDALFDDYPPFNLTEGPVETITNGHFNLNNPACLIYPKENGCQSIFQKISASDRDNFLRLIERKNPNWQTSHLQQMANTTTLLSFVSALAVLIVPLVKRFIIKH